jgi:hypothetical protein
MGICGKLSENVMRRLTKPFRWRKADNPWRQAPFSVTNLPTIIKVTADGVSQLPPKTLKPPLDKTAYSLTEMGEASGRRRL